MKTSLSSIPLLSQALRKYIRGLVHQECDVDDILHDIYLKMSDSKHAIEYPQGYEKRVAKNVVFDMQQDEFNQYADIFLNSERENGAQDETR
ncbi:MULTISPECIES: hypothetical protein [Colwelliaceae]|uniref:hypothetical protein n=1 Tax=Colwelliaceae TaxID=267889 RepID=UPI000970473A|nr:MULTISPECIES: hypothetical protein [Colwelliaceae]